MEEAHAVKAPGSRKRRVQQRSIETRAKILECAARAFATTGFEGTSTRAIATELGIAHALVLYHFATKEGLWQAVVQHAVGGLRIEVEHNEENEPVSAAERLRKIMEAFVRFSADKHQMHQIFAHASRNGGPELDWLIASIAPLYKMLSGLMRECQAAGKFVQGDPHMLVYLFLVTATHPYQHPRELELSTGRQLTHPATVDEHVRLCLALFFRD